VHVTAPVGRETNVRLLLERLHEIALSGPLRAVGKGSPAVGLTLLNALGVELTTTRKPQFHGIVVSARRRKATPSENRVNLFARVPNWGRSAKKSSAEILNAFGYKGKPDGMRLYCSVSAKRPNAQGLWFVVDTAAGLLREVAGVGSQSRDVAVWELRDLEKRLAATHPQSMWVEARASKRGGHDYFHYQRASYMGPPLLDRFVPLLDAGTITMDHLIKEVSGRVQEKGPLFKIAPANVGMLFPKPSSFDLLSSGLGAA
jgi:hypothetical protein